MPTSQEPIAHEATPKVLGSVPDEVAPCNRLSNPCQPSLRMAVELQRVLIVPPCRQLTRYYFFFTPLLLQGSGWDAGARRIGKLTILLQQALSTTTSAACMKVVDFYLHQEAQSSLLVSAFRSFQ